MMQIVARRAMGITKPRRVVPRQLAPDIQRLGYFKKLVGVLEAARAQINRHLIPYLADILREGKEARGDAWNTDTTKRVQESIDRAVSDFDKSYQGSQRYWEGIAHATAQDTSEFQKEQLAKQARAALGVDLPMPDPGLTVRIDDFVRNNVALITTVPRQYFEQVQQTVMNGVRSGIRHEDIATEIAERFDVSESRAKLIARDQVGKFFGELNKARQQGLGVDSFIWRTVHDGRVRDEHEALDGETFKWSEPPAEGIPGMPINCRCNAEPDFAAILKDLE